MKEKPFILNIESATGVCSVCVSRGADILAFREASETFQHAKVLTNLIDKCLRDSGFGLEEMDAVAVSSGPGSYTSLRVGLSTAKGICYALGLPLIGVGTLRALALAAKNELEDEAAIYCPMIDARRMEVYCEIFDGQGNPLSEAAAKIIDEHSFKQFFEQSKTMVFCGNGAEKCRNVLNDPCALFCPLECSATYLPELSLQRYLKQEFEDVAYFTPHYLKPPNITIPKNMNLLKA